MTPPRHQHHQDRPIHATSVVETATHGLDSTTTVDAVRKPNSQAQEIYGLPRL